MKSLAETHPFLQDRKVAEAFLWKSTYGSSLFEGAKGLLALADRSKPSAKNAARPAKSPK